jgi:hypothetical protein
MTLHLITVDVLLSRLSSNCTSHTVKRCDALWARCAWRMWRSSITKLELSPWWVCRSFFSLGIGCLPYWSKCPVCYRRTDMCLLALKHHIKDNHL